MNDWKQDSNPGLLHPEPTDSELYALPNSAAWVSQDIQIASPSSETLQGFQFRLVTSFSTEFFISSLIPPPASLVLFLA